MEKHIIVLGAINIDRIKAILEAAGFRICDRLSVENYGITLFDHLGFRI